MSATNIGIFNRNNSSATQISSNSTVVACLGESLTKGEVSYDWIADLQSRPQNASIRFVNLGVGGDHSYNALKRLPQVIQCHPNKVVVLIGGGDAICMVSAARDRVFRIWKRLPQKHSLVWFEENIRQLVSKLKSETTARVALCSLPLIGEDPNSEVNRQIREFSIAIKQIASEEEVSYISFFERMYEQVIVSPGRAFTSNFLVDFLSECRAAFKILVLHKSLDEVGEQGGWQFHVDGIHLNSCAGKILADLVQEFVAA